MKKLGLKILTDFIRKINSIAAKRTGIVISERSGGREQNRGRGEMILIVQGWGGGTREGMWVFKMNDLFCCTD